MKKVYYVVEKEIDGDGNGDEWVTGNKSISVYEIENNDLKLVFDLTIDNEDNSLTAIKDYVDDNCLWDGLEIEYKQI